MEAENIVIICIIVIVLGFTGFLVVGKTDKKRRLMIQCLSDGHKEYECESALKSNNSSIRFMPIR